MPLKRRRWKDFCQTTAICSGMHRSHHLLCAQVCNLSACDTEHSCDKALPVLCMHLRLLYRDFQKSANLRFCSTPLFCPISELFAFLVLVSGPLQVMAGSLWILVVQSQADCTSSAAESEDHTILSTLQTFLYRWYHQLNAVYILSAC